MRSIATAGLVIVMAVACAGGQPRALAQTAERAYTAAECPSCAVWNAPTAPVRLFANTYYVGTRGLAAVLVASDSGHVLVDAGLPESAPLIMANVRALGFRVGDIRLIVNSHAHYDHAGGVASVAADRDGSTSGSGGVPPVRGECAQSAGPSAGHGAGKMSHHCILDQD